VAWFACLSLGTQVAAAGQGQPASGPRATVREHRRVIPTYPFSDPNPIATVGRIYPYFRFDGYTDTPVDREWQVVELENAYLKVTVLPEIGGKIWSAVEKSTGRSFIYDNHVVKFRDIAMRGPWTSGGIEPNYGIIGHTPNCATPVDYSAWHDEHAAHVVIGVLDLLTRTRWRLKITLPADKAYFTTESFWQNGTPIEQPYYTWMNTGIKAAGNLELIYPGTHYIGHEGEVFPWPIHPGNGKNLAFYEQNDFGPYKSYHVLGRHSDFFGAYWHDDDFGMGRYSARDDKLGKKAWIWGLSRQGMIWEQLLTDTDGQYVEVQSGRLFNQAAEGSTRTPFKHHGFQPYATDAWTEYWFPVKATKGFVTANEHGALNVTAEKGRLTVRFSPLQAFNGMLQVLDGERVAFSAKLALSPMQTWSQAIDADIPRARLQVRIGDVLEYRGDAGDELSRPLEAPKDFDWESVQGLWLQGKEWMRQREYVAAQASLEQCLKKDPHFLPALADMAIVCYRAMDYQGARDLALRGLAIDTYDPASNYYYALASSRLGKTTDALDGLEVAALHPAFRAAAWTELARLHFARGAPASAGRYARRVLEGDRLNAEAWRIAALAARVRGDEREAQEALRAIRSIDPTDAFGAFELRLISHEASGGGGLQNVVRNEMPHETYLELAIWYHNLGRPDEARQVLELAPPQAEVLYWLAYLQHQRQNPAANAALRKAEAASPHLVFPFRSESARVFEWAMTQTPTWRPKYYLALILWSRNETVRARQLLEQCGETADFPPLYAARARAFDPVSRDRALTDLERAAGMDPRSWRYGRLLVERFIEDKDYRASLETATRYHEADPGNYIIGMLHAKSLLLNGRFAEADQALRGLKVLPYEGATEGRGLYREAQLMLAVEHLKAGRAQDALKRVAAAREWPEHLGAGKPYSEDVDERLEDWLEAQALERQGQGPASRIALERLAADGSRPGPARLLSAVALSRLDRMSDATGALDAWAAATRDPATLAWGRAFFAGQRPAPLEPGSAPLEQRVIAALLR
jgi:tetratricopeptide (TPR) repeat protein